jgi:anti-sigma factor RsiW
MSHERLQGMLDDYASGTLTLPEREEVRAHLEECEACRADAEFLHTLLADAAALPRDVAPPRDLWQGIAAKLEPRATMDAGPAAVERPGAPALVIVAPPAGTAARDEAEEEAKVIPFRRRTVQVPRWLLAAAAVAVMALSSGVTALMMDRSPGGGGTGGDDGGVVLPTTTETAAAPTALVAFQQGERSYRDAIGDLERLLAAKRDRMAPETAATLERNLAIIDAAIDDSRRALEADPNNHELAQMLNRVYETKVSTLQRAVEL